MSFTYNGTLTVTSDSAKLPSTQTDFPVLVAFTDNSLKSIANGGFMAALGLDFRLFSDAALTTTVPFQFIAHDAVTGTIYCWVKPASVALGDKIYAGFGDPALNTNASSTSTWNSGYKGVWHPSASTFSDWTDIESFLTGGAGIQGVTFDGTYLYIRDGDSALGHISKWQKTAGVWGIVAERDLAAIGDNIDYANAPTYKDGYIYIAAPYPGTGPQANVYPRVIRLNAFDLTFDSTFINDTARTNTFIEQIVFHDGYWWASDEVTAQLLKYDTSGVYVGAYALPTGDTSTAYHGYDGAEFWTEGGTTYVGLAIHNGRTNQAFVICSFDGTTFTEVARKPWHWANQGFSRDPSVSDASRMWFADRTADGVHPNYVRLRDISRWSVSPSALVDSTGVNNGTVTGSIGDDTGRINRGMFASGDGNYISLGNNASLNPSAGGAMTIELWLKILTLPANGAYHDVIKKWGAGGNSYELWVTGADQGIMKFSTVASSANAAIITTPSLNVWHHVVGVHSGGVSSIYVDGVKGTDGTEGFNSSTQPTVIFSDLDADDSFGCIAEELRISNVARSANWITADYYQTPGSGFLSAVFEPTSKPRVSVFII